MDLHDFLNVRRVLKHVAKGWGVPVIVAKATIQRRLDGVWNNAQGNPAAAEKLARYFPAGKPTPEEYILCLGRAYERGEDFPEF